MMERVRTIGAICTLFLVAACGGSQALPPPPQAPPPVTPPKPLTAPAPVEVRPDTPDAAFREKAPDPDGTVVFTAPKVETFRLKNGIRVFFVERHELPIVSVRVAIKGGAGDYPSLRPGVAASMGSMLEQGGTKSRNPLQLSDEYEEIGAQHNAYCTWDACSGVVQTLSGKIDKGLTLLGDVLLQPSFPDAEIERQRTRRLAQLAHEKGDPPSMAQNTDAAALYGRAHPYGHSLYGGVDDAKSITRADLVKAYQMIFTPKNAAILVSGDITRQALQGKLEAAFGGWKAQPGAADPRPPSLPAAGKTPRFVLVDKPGASQSQVQVLDVGVPMRTPDRDAIRVMNAILGGMFTSRINLNLREDKNVTYGAHSHFVMRHGAGPFLAGGAMVAEKTAIAATELLREVQRMIDEDVKDDELAKAKSDIVLSLPAQFETVGSVTGSLENLFTYGLPADEYSKLQARIDAVTVKDVRRVAKKYLHPDALKVVVVGDRAKLESELVAALHLGPPEVRDGYGDVVK